MIVAHGAGAALGGGVVSLVALLVGGGALLLLALGLWLFVYAASILSVRLVSTNDGLVLRNRRFRRLSIPWEDVNGFEARDLGHPRLSRLNLIRPRRAILVARLVDGEERTLDATETWLFSDPPVQPPRADEWLDCLEDLRTPQHRA
ncbi:MAG: hypothetical protein GY798_25470 [Hyphomicrobiales bacterium]|nr:hypothetical protein [Hyphomicrobiales bacterium]